MCECWICGIKQKLSKYHLYDDIYHAAISRNMVIMDYCVTCWNRTMTGKDSKFRDHFWKLRENRVITHGEQ